MHRVISIALVLLSVGLVDVVAGSGFERIGDVPTISIHTNQREIEDGRLPLKVVVNRGRALFTASFNTLDGAGRPTTTGGMEQRDRQEFPDNFNRISGPDSNSCVGCHNLPGIGGGGDNVANVFVLAQQRPFVTFGAENGDDQSALTLKLVGNERNTVGMFGSGYIELLAREMTFDLQSIREGAIQEAQRSGQPVTRALVAKGVSFGQIAALPDGTLDTTGVEGVDADLVIKPFHQKGAVVSLREFSVNAANHHHGLQSSERFGDGVDADGDGVVDELTRGDITALTLFQALLPPPTVVEPVGRAARQAVIRGRDLFSATGCVACHMPALPLYSTIFAEPGPFNPPLILQAGESGTSYAVDLAKKAPVHGASVDASGILWVPVFTDLKRHAMGPILDNEEIEQNGIPTDVWLTRKLWGFASEPPFLHHGRATLISEAVLAHGGEAQDARDRYAALPEADRNAIVEFLKTLQTASQP
ncbi:MAG: hypothetical protein O3B84_05155 [Chloroflexi bacterium]|nr:hypothetical protein [Chloroflexota bacterium]